jgi:hypothetical protein
MHHCTVHISFLIPNATLLTPNTNIKKYPKRPPNALNPSLFGVRNDLRVDIIWNFLHQA